jgi:DNA-binding XRE family transcriptional regulator
MIPPGYTVLEDGTIIGKQGRPLKLSLNDQGYPRFGARINGKTVTFIVHQVVCTLFHGPKPFPGAQVRHLNGVKTDNRASNLKWGTPVENAADRKIHGTNNEGEEHAQAKLTWERVREIREVYATSGLTLRKLAARYGVHATTLAHVLDGRTWVDPGYLPPVRPRTSQGVRHGQAKLTDQQVREIRNRYAAGEVTQRELATDYGISRETVGTIIRRKNWAHI